MSWATVLKAGLKFMGSGAKATAKTVGHTVLHPQQTIKGMGTATKTAAVGAATGYVAWEKLTTDKSVARIVGDAVVGSDTSPESSVMPSSVLTPSTALARRWKESAMPSATSARLPVMP